MTKLFVRSLAIAAFAFTGAQVAHAQTVLQLSYPSSAPGTTPCIYTTNFAGISADPQTGNLLATGDFGTGCPQTGSALPLPVIVPGPGNWQSQLPNPWALNQTAMVQWAAVNAESCVYAGSSASGWPSGQQACSNIAACQTLHDVTLIPQTPGQYQFSLTCTNATGQSTSTSPFRDVVANPPVITQGPSSWNVTPWTSGQTRSVQWSATNADNCNFSATTLPAGVTIGQFLSGGIATCSSQATCASTNTLILNATAAGTYALTMTCSRTTGGTVTNSASWNVTQSSSGNCLSPATGWTRLETAEIFNVGAFNSVGFQDVTSYDSIWGRNYSVSGYPIESQWPGVNNQLVAPKFGNQRYISAKFRTPASGQRGHSLVPDGTAFAAAGGGTGTNALLSATVSTVCGDFDTGSVNIPPNCTRSQMIGGGGRPEDSLPIFSNAAVSPAYCALQPNTDYYLNLIFSPLTSPASATFNGLGGFGGTLLLQNQNVF